ncbi:hypothetical protein GCM10008910_01210 [Faecalicatena orotica]
MANERVLPFNMLKHLINILELDENILFSKMANHFTTYCSIYIPKTVNENIVWPHEQYVRIDELKMNGFPPKSAISQRT